MIGIFVLALMGLWVWFAIWLSRAISNRLLSRVGEVSSSKNSSLQPIIYWVGRVFLMVIITFLPFLDQLVAYPKWQQLCATTSDFEWGSGMDEKKAFGRELIVSDTTHETRIFPNIHVTYFSKQFRDAKTGELVLNMPHYSYYKARGMFYLPSGSGDNRAIFLSRCTTSRNTKPVLDYLNQFNLRVVGYN